MMMVRKEPVKLDFLTLVFGSIWKINKKTSINCHRVKNHVTDHDFLHIFEH